MAAAEVTDLLETPKGDVTSGIDAAFRAFVGPNHELYERTLVKMRAKDPALRKIPLTWCWPAFLITIPWLMYRKLYGLAAGLIGGVIAISLLFPEISNTGTAGGFAAIGMLAKTTYVQHAQKRIQKLRSRATSEEELEALVKRAGGVSIPGAVIGTILFIGFNVLAFMTSFAERG
jgi:hypothetical protein